MKPDKGTRKRRLVRSLLVALACVSLSAVVIARESFSYEEALLPAAHTSADLSVCTHVESYVRGNEDLAKQLSAKEAQLFDAVMTSGWSSEDFAGALTFVQTQETIDLEPHDNESDQAALARYFDKDYCQKSLESADKLIDEGLLRK